MSYRFVQKLKSLGAVLSILFLLPYIVTICMNGVRDKQDGQEVLFSVKVQCEESEALQEIAWETYLTGVLAKEISWQEEEEFLKAQTVLLRTRLYQELENSEDKILADQYLTKQEIEEKLGVLDGRVYYEKLEQAVKDTGNQVLFYGNAYAWTPFYYSSNGTGRSAKEVMNTDEFPYLTVKECPLDKGADKEIKVLTFTYKEIQTKCQSFLVAVAEENAEKVYQYEDFGIVSYDSAGYVLEMKIGETTCTGDQFRDALGLQSSAFTMQDKNGKLQITTVGRGHGLGMSQWTARKMAEEGKTYEEILQFFFEGTTLASGGEIFTKTE